MLKTATQKSCVIYKSMGEHTPEAFNQWLDSCEHTALNLVGAASSKAGAQATVTLDVAAAALAAHKKPFKFGCVTIAERHLAKNREHENILRKMDAGAKWFISQAVYDVGATVKLLNDYGELCRQRGVCPRKIVLTFAPCGKKKTMKFIKWLGISVPKDVEERLFASLPEGETETKGESLKQTCKECLVILEDILNKILHSTAQSGVPLGINVESVSIGKAETEAAHTLFQNLQKSMLDYYACQWTIRWVSVGPAGAADGELEEKEEETSMLPAPQVAQLGLAAVVGAVATIIALNVRARVMN